MLTKTLLTAVTAASFHRSAFSQIIAPDEVMEKPLIAGAGVSADRSTSSPCKRLALRYIEKSKIKNIAYGGRPGCEVIKEIKPQVVKDRSIIRATDFLFWDSTLPEIGPSRLWGIS